MAFPDLAANLLYTVLCLVPGFISLQTVRVAADLEMELSEFEKSTWSLIGSGVSLSLLYFCYVGWTSVATGRVELVRAIELGWVDLVAVYPLLLAVAVLVGYVSAAVLGRTFGSSRQPDVARSTAGESEVSLENGGVLSERHDR